MIFDGRTCSKDEMDYQEEMAEMDPKASLDFLEKTGEKGEIGPRGKDGLPGEQGLVGPIGSPGATGRRGPVGSGAGSCRSSR